MDLYFVPSGNLESSSDEGGGGTQLGKDSLNIQKGFRQLILHVDVDNFYVSVHRIYETSLNLQPVCIHQHNAGGIIALSDEAKKLGITKGEGIGARGNVALKRNGRTIPQLRKEFPQVLFREIDTNIYRQHRDRMREWLKRNAGEGSVVESVSWDDSYIDITSIDAPSSTGEPQFTCTSDAPLSPLLNRACECAQTLRSKIMRDLGLPITVGVARSKLAAKLAGGLGKPSSGGVGVCVVPDGGEAELFRRLPAVKVLGRAMMEGVRDMFDDREEFYRLTIPGVLNLPGIPWQLYDTCLKLQSGVIDEDPVVDRGQPKSISQQRSFNPSPVSKDLVTSLLTRLLTLVENDGRIPSKFVVQSDSADRTSSKSKTYQWVGHNLDRAVDLVLTFTGGEVITGVSVKAVFPEKVVEAGNKLTDYFGGKKKKRNPFNISMDGPVTPSPAPPPKRKPLPKGLPPF